MTLTTPSTYYGTTNNEIQVAVVFTPSYNANGNLQVQADLFDGDPVGGTPVDSCVNTWQGYDSMNVALSASGVSIQGSYNSGLGQIGFMGTFQSASVIINLNAPVAAYGNTEDFANNSSIGRITGKAIGATKEAKVHFTTEITSTAARFATQFNGQLAYNDILSSSPTQTIDINADGLSLQGKLTFTDNTVYFNGSAIYAGQAQIGFINAVVGCYMKPI